MADYTYRSWETMSPFYPVQEITYYRIFDDEDNAEDNVDPIWSGVVLPGYSLSHLENILTQYVQPQPLDYLTDNTVRTDFDMCKTFYVTSSIDNDNWYSEGSIKIYYDWSYDYNSLSPNIHPVILTSMTSHVVDPRQYFFLSSCAYDEYNNLYILRQGTIIQWYDPVRDTYKHGEISLAAKGFKDGDYLVVMHIYYTGTSYYYFPVKTTCHNYCLYYMNERGGYDTFLIDGKETQRDKMTPNTYKKNYNYTLPQNTNINVDPGTIVYRKDIKESWELNTGWLNEDNAERATSLLHSTRVYLHDFNKDTVTPVVITNSTADHKTYKNQNRRLIQYVINVESAQEKHVE